MFNGRPPPLDAGNKSSYHCTLYIVALAEVVGVNGVKTRGDGDVWSASASASLISVCVPMEYCFRLICVRQNFDLNLNLSPTHCRSSPLSQGLTPIALTVENFPGFKEHLSL